MKTSISPIPKPALKWLSLVILAWLIQRALNRHFDAASAARKQDIDPPPSPFDTPNPSLN